MITYFLCSFQGSFWSRDSSILTSCDTGLDADFCFFRFVASESGGKRTRTADFLRARQALYQLSYTPTKQVLISGFLNCEFLIHFSLLQFHYFFSRWAILDLNQGPHPYQGCALTN